MILNRLLLIITFCLIVINADEIDFGSKRTFAIRDPWDGDVLVNNCIYNTYYRYISCRFQKKKYNDKNLSVEIPITNTTGGDLSYHDNVSSVTIYAYNKKTGKYKSTDVLATTSPWEIIEKGDRYDVPEKSKIEVSVTYSYPSLHSKDVYLYYEEVLVK